MGAPARLGLYGVLLVVVFAVAAIGASALVPDDVVERWVRDVETSEHHVTDERRVGERRVDPEGQGHEHGR